MILDIIIVIIFIINNNNLLFIGRIMINSDLRPNQKSMIEDRVWNPDYLEMSEDKVNIIIIIK